MMRKLIWALVVALMLGLGLGAAQAADEDEEYVPIPIALNTQLAGSVPANETVVHYQYKLTGTAPQLVTIQLTTPSYGLLLFDNTTELYADDYYGAAWPHTYTFRNVLSAHTAGRPGVFEFVVERAEDGSAVAANFSVKVTAEPLVLDEVERNDEWPANRANILALGAAPKLGAVTLSTEMRLDEITAFPDEDTWTFSIPEDQAVNIRLKQIDQLLDFYVCQIVPGENPGDADELEYVGNKRQLEMAALHQLRSPVTTTTQMQLAEGDYVLVMLPSGDYPSNGRYELSFTTEKLKVASFSVPKTLKATVGMPFPLNLIRLNDDGVMPELEITTKKSSVLFVDGEEVYAIGAGADTVTIQRMDTGKTYKCAVTVYKNEFSRKKPLGGKARAVYTSTKKLNYGANGALKAEVFVYNKTGKPVSALGDLTLQVSVDMGGYGPLIYQKNIEAVGFAPPLKNGQYKVLKFELPLEDFPYPAGVFDLREGMIQVTLDTNYAVKGMGKAVTRGLRGAEKGAFEAKTAVQQP